MATATDQRTKPIHVRCTPEEHAEAQAKANRAGYSLSEYVRIFLREWDGPSGLEDRMNDLETRLERIESMAGVQH